MDFDCRFCDTILVLNFDILRESYHQFIVIERCNFEYFSPNFVNFEFYSQTQFLAKKSIDFIKH